MRLFLFILIAGFLAAPAFAADSAADQPDALISTPDQALPAPPAQPPTKDGTLTGGACTHDKDCLLGCAPKSQTITCVAVKEGSNECLKDRFYIPPEESCGCLPDIHRCGFIGHNVTHH